MKLKKSEIEKHLNQLKRDLESAISDASKASAAYSHDIHARQAFECGYLGSIIKNAVYTIEFMQK